MRSAGGSLFHELGSAAPRSQSLLSGSALAASAMKRKLEYRIPRLHSPVNSRRLPEIFEDSVRTKQASCRYSWKTVFSRLLP